MRHVRTCFVKVGGYKECVCACRHHCSCVCMHHSARAHVCVGVCVCGYLCVRVSVWVFVCLCVHRCVSLCMIVYACVYVSLGKRACVNREYMHVCACVFSFNSPSCNETDNLA